MFWKKLKVQHPEFGTLTYSSDSWASADFPSSVGPIYVRVPGDKSGPNGEAISNAQALMSDLPSIVNTAERFALSDTNTREFMEYNGDLTLDGLAFDVEPGTFTVAFGLTEWPDAMIDVAFREGNPVEVLLAD
ncbi:hypothetical protein [Rhodanobacter thiooxydans]|nr:hypothetical protein [Rhodanobacter thiooxydans]EIL96457.1 hypothetical protein UUA_17937 [Rhodanobacter thiooxydans LCS2]